MARVSQTDGARRSSPGLFRVPLINNRPIRSPGDGEAPPFARSTTPAGSTAAAVSTILRTTITAGCRGRFEREVAGVRRAVVAGIVHDERGRAAKRRPTRTGSRSIPSCPSRRHHARPGTSDMERVEPRTDPGSTSAAVVFAPSLPILSNCSDILCRRERRERAGGEAFVGRYQTLARGRQLALDFPRGVGRRQPSASIGARRRTRGPAMSRGALLRLAMDRGDTALAPVRAKNATPPRRSPTAAGNTVGPTVGGARGTR